MEIPVRILHLSNGNLEDPRVEARSLDDVGHLEPEGVYTVTRTYQGKQAVLLDAHLERIEESARLEAIPLHWDREAVRRGLRTLLEEASFPEARFRITVPREDPTKIWLAAEPLQPVPEEVRRRGVRVATRSLQRPNPRIKSNRWIAIRSEARRTLPPDAYEGIILSSEGNLLEGFSSNFFAVLGGALHTAHNVVLAGIARSILLQVAQDLITVQMTPVNLRDVPNLEEAFLTSSSRGVVPVVQIDRQAVGDGQPGPWTRLLSERYEAWVLEHLEPI